MASVVGMVRSSRSRQEAGSTWIRRPLRLLHDRAAIKVFHPIHLDRSLHSTSKHTLRCVTSIINIHQNLSHPCLPFRMSEVLQSHLLAGSTSNSKLPAPPPTDDQMERVRDLASQLHYGFKNRPPTDAEDRASWEKRFMRKFHAMLNILVVAKFEQLPPFAIGCVWENNRRLRLGEPKFDPELVVSAGSRGHPAYRPHTEGRLRYAPAFKGSPMALKEEQDIRDNWWRKSGAYRCIPFCVPRTNFGANCSTSRTS